MGFRTVEIPPSPKFQFHSTSAPGVVVELSVNWMGVLAQLLSGVKVKSADGFVPVITPLGIVIVYTQPPWVVTVREIV